MKAIPIREEDQFTTLSIKGMDKRAFLKLKNEYMAKKGIPEMEQHQFFEFVLLAFQDWRDMNDGKE